MNRLPEERQQMRLARMSTQFGSCFCTPDEVAAWQAGETFVDP